VAFLALPAILVLLFLPVTVESIYRLGGKDDGLFLRIGVGNWRPVQVPIRLRGGTSRPGGRLPGRLFASMDGSSRESSLAMLLRTSRFFSPYCRSIDLKVAVGTGDAASTGLAAGMLWGVWGAIQPLLPPSCRSNVAIQPHFNQRLLCVRAQCIFHLKLGHIILTRLGSIVRDNFQKGAKSFG
jgi:hypothetical protein